MTYDQLKESRSIKSFFDLPVKHQLDIKEFVYFYRPEFIFLNGSFYHGSYVLDLNSEFAELRKSLNKRTRISDCDIGVNVSCKHPMKFKSLDISFMIQGVQIYRNGIYS